ncbi:hypothetical protein F5Y17DRAFT_41101 [Xylariaceae sp. FL0594]|nr:hypothetical protein F5Y17DRAFT_41101 [Xylariaceae sp. FL0594]
MRLAFLPTSLALLGCAAALPGTAMKPSISTSTVMAAAHPITFWPLVTLGPDAKPITYTLPLTASRAPAGPYRSGVEAAVANTGDPSTHSAYPSAYGAQETVTPSASASSSSASGLTKVCTSITGAYPMSTIPAFCRPTMFSNAPALASPTDPAVALATAVVTMSANSVPDKLNCCAECANYYNCYAWRFVPSYTGHPSERLPGGFDPFRHGNCEIAYYTGTNATSERSVTTTEDTPSVCPNGRIVQHMLSGSNNAREQDPWTAGMYYNGWNDGACGHGGAIVFRKGRDKGYGGKSLCGRPT